jgi:uncharacterized protein
MATSTLQQMAEGGICDQLGGGFCRYSVDAHWMIPHFEKMLYDNAQLLPLYAQAWAVTNEGLFRDVAAGVAGWVMREMQSPGRRLLVEPRRRLGRRGGPLLCVDARGNPARAGTRRIRRGHRILRPRPRAQLRGPLAPAHVHVADQFAAGSGLDGGEVRARLASAHAKLFAAREARVRPGRDEKVLAAWNGLMIRGMSIAARILGDATSPSPRSAPWISCAASWWWTGGCKASWKDGRARLRGLPRRLCLHARCALEMLQLRWRARTSRSPWSWRTRC